jgi:glyoxylase-like metal-dependent hydrolase (beta-lactamase superfamily II)
MSSESLAARVVVAMALVTASCASRSPESELIQQAAQAIGGADRIVAARTLMVEGSGINGSWGQAFAPGGPLWEVKLTNYSRAVDLQNQRMRVRHVRTVEFDFPLQKVTNVEASLDGDVAFSVTPAGMTVRNNERVATFRRIEMMHHPLPLLRAALAQGATLTNLRQEGVHQLVDVRPTGSSDMLTLAVDSTTKLPARVTSHTYDLNAGDVDIVTTFSEYGDVGGFTLPRHVASTIDGMPQWDVRSTKTTVDGDVGDLAAPEAVRAAAPPPVEAPANVTIEEIGRGVWLLAGQSHNSVIVEFADHLTLIEAPMNQTRALAVIAKARELRPGKPLTDVIVTHHHFDHTGGLRAAVAEGLRVVAHTSYEPLFTALVGRKHSVVEDVLAKQPRPLMFQGVDDALVMKDEMNELRIYNLTGNTHAAGLLMAYLPRERLLYEADVFGTYVSYPFVPNLNAHMRKRGMQVERFVPTHGEMKTAEDFRKVLPNAIAIN